MEEEKLARINELARKSRTPEGLTPAEKRSRMRCVWNIGRLWSAI